MSKKIIFTLLNFIIILLLLTVSAKAVPKLLSPVNSARYQPTLNLELKWEASPNVSVYDVEYAADSLFTASSIIGSYSISGTKITITRLLNSTDYYWRVRNSGEDNWSDVWNFTTTGFAVKPQLLVPLNNSQSIDSALVFSWSADSVNANYLLTISSDSLFSSSNTINILTSTNNESVNGLNLFSTYYWKVQPYNIDKIPGPLSDVFNFKTKLPAPFLLFPVNDALSIDTSVILNWSPVQQALGYKIQVSLDSSFTNVFMNIGLPYTGTVFEINGLNRNTNYYWRVLATNFKGDTSGWSSINKFKTKLDYPYLITPPASAVNIDTAVVFSWHSSAGASAYRLQISSDKNYSNVLVDSVLSDTSAGIKTLNHNKIYFWRVSAKGVKGDSSGWAGQRYFKTNLAVPTLVQPVNGSSNNILTPVVEWSVVDGASIYTLKVSIDSAFNKIIKDTLINTNSLQMDSLIYDTTYFWKIKAANLTGDSSLWSHIFSFKIMPAIIIKPLALEDTLNLSFDSTDIAGKISILNMSGSSYIIDNAIVSPDTLYSIDKKSATILPDSQETFIVRLNSINISAGINKGVLKLIRAGTQVKRDTIFIPINLFIQRAFASLSADTIVFDTTHSSKVKTEKLFVNNIAGNVSLKIKDIILAGDSNSFVLADLPDSVAAEDSLSLNVEFKPYKQGLNKAILTLITNSFPARNYNLYLEGWAVGGEPSKYSIDKINSLADSTFETFTSNDKALTVANTGNTALNLSFNFVRNYFKVTNYFQQFITIKAGDSVKVNLKYLTPDFKNENIDTLLIIHDGFGNDTLSVVLTGGFDSTLSSNVLQKNLRLNGLDFSTASNVVPENSQMIVTLNPKLFEELSNLDFRVNYYTGGAGTKHTITNDGSYNYIIPREDVNKRGLIYYSQLFTKGKNGKDADSITIFDYINVQVLLNKYTTIPVSVPISQPAETADKANTKWIMFGFPFDEVVADSVFKYFGGISKMQDGEWIIYKFNSTAKDSFEVFNSYSFQPASAYFIAQSLVDTFKIKYTYNNYIRTRKLTDTLLILPQSDWKTVSNPFLFDVEVDSSVTLRRYDTNNKVYKMTNIMEPGKGYFVEPAVKKIKLKTFGRYNPLYYPQIVASIGWHLKLQASGSKNINEVLCSIKSANDELAKSSASVHSVDFPDPPRIQRGLYTYIISDNKDVKNNVSVKYANEGAEWNIAILNDLEDDVVKINPSLIGNVPNQYECVIYDQSKNNIISSNDYSFIIKKNKKYVFKVIIGTSSYIKQKIAGIKTELPTKFELYQNYPNPFNPSTTISYEIPKESIVTIKIFDVLGREAAELLNANQKAGKYEVEWNAKNFASGVYFYQLKAGAYESIKKMILLR